MLDSIIFCSTLALCDSLHSLLCRCTLFLSCTPTFVNWALPANKLRVMYCVFIKNMLRKHTPIKDSVFHTKRGAEHWVWEEEPSAAATSLHCAAEFVYTAAGCLLEGLNLDCSSPPLLHGATPCRRAARGNGHCACVKHSTYSITGRGCLQTSSLFPCSTGDLNAVKALSSQNFFMINTKSSNSIYQ